MPLDKFGRAGSSVLWFLVGCLVLVNAIATISSGVVGSKQPGLALSILLYSLASMAMILACLMCMFRSDPTHLLAHKEDIRFIEAFRMLSAHTDPSLLQNLISRMDPSLLGEPAQNDVVRDTELDKLNEELERLKSGRSGP